jgi:hypothetical protein
MAQYDIIGTFVFRNDGDGCLSGKYVNKDSTNGPLGEVCKGKKGNKSKVVFVGKYDVVWLEDKGHRSSILTITHNSSRNMYNLTWENKDKDNYSYKGIGMLYDGLLVGSYWSDESK